ncbi:MAG TPA: TetR/AcrR family transcriptional regulator [Terriglobales bacterium]|jgi:AcrR family transcriptional regulator|nr:TetR/AcrR family transcriptional regulator [Terriglobales bacterium]
MSRNATTVSPRVRKTDRRVRRTRDALGDALVALMHEQPFDDITVQQVLDRAGVSRATFYTHYRDKNDLFLSDLEDFLEHMAFHLSRRREVSRRIAPVRELFAHVAEWRKFHAVLVEAGKIRDFLELGQGYFARAIERRLAELGEQLPASMATAQMYAGALLALLTWWLTSGMPGTPEQMDDLYHQMVWSGANFGPAGRPPTSAKRSALKHVSRAFNL